MTMPADHLDDEQLSAFLDGEVDDAARVHVDAHVATCEACRLRFEAFDRHARMVGTPPPALVPSAADAMVTAALTGARPESGTEARVIDLAARRRLRYAPALLAAVAVIAAVLAVPALLRTDTANDELATTAGGDGAKTEAFSAADDSASLGARAGGSAGDAAADTAIEAAPTADALTAEAGAPPRARALGAYSDDDDLVRRLVAELSTTPGGQTDEAAAVCGDAARDVGGTRVGSLVYVSTLEWRTEPAEVLVFALTEPLGEITRQAYVMTTPACRLLAEPRF